MGPPIHLLYGASFSCWSYMFCCVVPANAIFGLPDGAVLFCVGPQMNLLYGGALLGGSIKAVQCFGIMLWENMRNKNMFWDNSPCGFPNMGQ